MCHMCYMFHRKVMFRSGDIFAFLNISLNHNSLTRQIWSIDRYKQGQHFFEIFWMTCRTRAKFQTFSNLATCSNYSITNYAKFTVFHFLEKGERIKNGKYQPLSIIKGPGTNFECPALSQKHVSNVWYKIH